MGDRKTDLKLITAEEAERAKQRLQRTTSFDIDEFLAEHTVDFIFNTPLGSTPHCLTVDQIAAAAANKEIGDAATHLQQCQECLAQLDSYRLLAETNFSDAMKDVAIGNYIRVPAGKNLFLVLYNRGKKPVLTELDPKSIEVAGAISGKVKSISRVDPKQYKAREAVAIHFENYTLHVPESGEAIGDLYFGARTKQGRVSKRCTVHVIDEARVQASEQAAVN
jgi:hypothetical protein